MRKVTKHCRGLPTACPGAGPRALGFNVCPAGSLSSLTTPLPPFCSVNVSLCHCMLAMFNFLLIFTGAPSCQLALSLSGDSGPGLFSSAGPVKTALTLRHGLHAFDWILHEEIHRSLSGAGSGMLRVRSRAVTPKASSV